MIRPWPRLWSAPSAPNYPPTAPGTAHEPKSAHRPSVPAGELAARACEAAGLAAEAEPDFDDGAAAGAGAGAAELPAGVLLVAGSHYAHRARPGRAATVSALDVRGFGRWIEAPARNCSR